MLCPGLIPAGEETASGGLRLVRFRLLGVHGLCECADAGLEPGVEVRIHEDAGPGRGAMLYGIGVLMGSSRLNWFVGIRTPWTLSSEEVWDRTHEVGARLFKACGVMALAGVLLDGLPALLLAVAPIMVASVYLLHFSYSEYQRRTLERSLWRACGSGGSTSHRSGSLVEGYRLRDGLGLSHCVECEGDGPESVVVNALNVICMP